MPVVKTKKGLRGVFENNRSYILKIWSEIDKSLKFAGVYFWESSK